jgi:hypothetical protein
MIMMMKNPIKKYLDTNIYNALMSHYSEIADCFCKKYVYANSTFTGEASLDIDRGGWLNDRSRTLELLIDCICEHVQK